MHRSLSFWMTVVAVVSYGLGTAPFTHGVLCWAIGTVAVVGMRFASRKGW